MKEFEFTKGEWYIGDNNDVYSKGELISAIRFLGTIRKSESDANQKLISSAPNLLYALIDLVEIVDNLPEDKSILTALENAKKAIDKATK